MPDDPRHRLDDVPDLTDAPLDWDAGRRRFRDQDGSGAAGDDGYEIDGRHLVVAAPPDGATAAPPPRRTPQIVLPEPPMRTQGPGVTVSPGRPAPRNQPSTRSRSTTDTHAARSWWPPDRRTVLRATGAAAILLLLLVVGGALWGYQKFDQIERVDLDGLLATSNGTNYLIVGSDTREGIDPDDPNAGAILGPEAPVGPERSDTILVLRIDGDGARMLSVPRDLLVTIAETGQRTRINAAFNGGPTRLIATLTDQLGLPIHHYLEVDFVSFRDLVDALGGIVIDFPHPAFDEKSGLRVETAGQVTLDGDQALAYVRSRYYTELVDGKEVRDPTGDLGRVVRQQKFLAAVMTEVGSIRNPIRLVAITNAMVDGMRIDQRLGFFDALGLMLRFRGLDPQPETLPTSNATLSSGAQVLNLVQPGGDEILADFGSPGASTG